MKILSKMLLQSGKNSVPVFLLRMFFFAKSALLLLNSVDLAIKHFIHYLKCYLENKILNVPMSCDAVNRYYKDRKLKLYTHKSTKPSH